MPGTEIQAGAKFDTQIGAVTETNCRYTLQFASPVIKDFRFQLSK